LLSERLGIVIEFVIFPNWNTLLENGKQKNIDVIFAAQRSHGREAYLDFSESVLQVNNYWVVNTSRNAHRSESKLNVVSPEGSAVYEHFSSDSHQDTMNMIGAFDAKEALLKVSNKEVDAAIMDSGRVSYYMKTLDLDNIKIEGRVGFDYQLRMATVKDDKHLIEYLQAGMNLISENELESLKAKWGLRLEDDINWLLIIVYTAVLIILLGFSGLIYRKNRQLQKEIQLRIEFEQQLAIANANIQIEKGKAQKEARTDPLTGIDNLRRFFEYLNDEIKLYKRKKNPFCVMMIDIDHFKKVNDQYGHDIGDLALKSLSQHIEANIRPYDHLARIGGEEFAVLLPETPVEEAVRVAERVREFVEQAPLEIIGAITISLGIAEINEDDTIDSLLRRADEGLYLSKENGRNQVTVRE